MFVTHDKSVAKKKIQKPNILRRKPKCQTNVLKLANTDTLETQSSKQGLNKYSEYLSEKSDTEIINKKRIKSITSPKKLYQIVNEESILNYQIIENDNITSKLNSFTSADLIVQNSNSTEDDVVPTSINIDSFLISDSRKQSFPLTSQVKRGQGNEIAKANDKLCFGFIDTSNRVVIEQCDTMTEDFYLDQKSDLVNTMVPLSAISTLESSVNTYNVQVPTLKRQTYSIEDLTQKSVRYKCDESNCNKEFLSEQKLLKHKNTHTKECRAPRQTTLECPVKKLDVNSTEVPCGRVFQVRGDLLKHLNEEHTPDDAAYICSECDRRFFWASGLRAHGRSHAGGRARAALACPWPGCGRVFRQPCRLREHSRAHTGDKPYHCRHPNCGWAFRTASKLLRHSRRHTGDRRHPCAACDRAFLRREHLREHVARHHAPARAPHVCPHHDCKQTFTNMSSLYTHMKKVHPKEDTNDIVDPIPNNEQDLSKPGNMFMVNLWDGSATLELVDEKKNDTQDLTIESKSNDIDIELEIQNPVDVDMEGLGEVEAISEVEVEGHSARTHCTWPLVQKAFKDCTEEYVLEDDVQVEQSEGSESNIYTVRSDLFLHGSVFHNEDSEQMCGERLTLDADLLLDAPSTDLAQEELYTDAVDESSFRVFLLSGEELS